MELLKTIIALEENKKTTLFSQHIIL